MKSKIRGIVGVIEITVTNDDIDIMYTVPIYALAKHIGTTDNSSHSAMALRFVE